MADLYGATAVPLAVTTPAGDPALRDIADYCQAVLNTYASTAWVALEPAHTQVVRNAFTHDPRPAHHEFNANDLPALYVFRERGTFGDFSQSIRRAEDAATMLWVFPAAPPPKQTVRSALAPGIMRMLDTLLERGRDPSWTKATDSDVTAPAIAADPDAIKLAFATSTSPQTYSGAALDGIVGDDVMNPRRALTLTQAAAVGAYSTDPVTVTYETWSGGEATVTFTPTVNGGVVHTMTSEAKRAVSASFPAQPGIFGTWQLGTAARSGRGSVLLQTAKLRELRMLDWKVEQVVIQVKDADGRTSFSMPYQAVSAQLRLREDLVVDLSDTTRFHPHDSIENDFVDEDGELIEQQQLPDDGA